MDFFSRANVYSIRNNPLRNADNKYVTTPENDSIDNRTRVQNVSPDISAGTPPAFAPSMSASSSQSQQRAPNGRGRDERHVLPTSAPSPPVSHTKDGKGTDGRNNHTRQGKSNGSAAGGRRDADRVPNSQASASMDVDDEKEEGEYDREEGEL